MRSGYISRRLGQVNPLAEVGAFAPIAYEMNQAIARDAPVGSPPWYCSLPAAASWSETCALFQGVPTGPTSAPSSPSSPPFSGPSQTPDQIIAAQTAATRAAQQQAAAQQAADYAAQIAATQPPSQPMPDNTSLWVVGGVIVALWLVSQALK